MSSSQLCLEKAQSIKENELNQKSLKALEKYQNELNKEIKDTLIISKYKYDDNKNNKEKKKDQKDKEFILKSVREIMINFYRKNEKSLNPVIKSMDQKGFDYMLNQIKVIELFNAETFLKTQYVDNKSFNKGFNIINLNENEDLNPKKKNDSKSKNIKNHQKNKNQENKENQKDIKENKKIKSAGIINIKKSKIFFGNEYLDDIQDKKTIVKNPSKSNKINELNEYSYKCLSNNLFFSIQKGFEEIKFAIEIENNGLFPWPKNKTFLEIDNSKSSINAQNIQLEPLNPGIKAPVIIIVNQINKYKPGKYCICLDFKIDGQKYGESILINIEIIENINKIKNKTVIEAFRKEYGFKKSDFSDTIIGNALEKYHNFENVEQIIFENKTKNNSCNCLL